MIGGIVASPTPMVPMSGDSMTVMTMPVPGRARDNMLAASHPAVPPPTMAMRWIAMSHAKDAAGRWRAGLTACPSRRRSSGVPIVVGERQIRPLQVGVLRRIGEVLHRYHHAEVDVEIVADLGVELAVGSLRIPR